VPTSYSPTLKTLRGLRIDEFDEYNATLGIRDGENCLINYRNAIALPTREQLEPFLATIDITPAEKKSIIDSRMYALCSRYKPCDPVNMTILIAIHLRYGNALWNECSFRDGFVVFGPGSQSVQEFMYNDDGELTPFGATLDFHQGDDIYSALGHAAQSPRSMGGISLGEIAFLVARDPQAFKRKRSYDFRNGERYDPDGFNQSLCDIRSVLAYDDDSVLAWWMKLGFNGVDSYLPEAPEFLAWIDGRASYDEIVPFIVSNALPDPNTVVELAKHGIDNSLYASLVDGV
jgi:hypothetical protein